MYKLLDCASNKTERDIPKVKVLGINKLTTVELRSIYIPSQTATKNGFTFRTEEEASTLQIVVHFPTRFIHECLFTKFFIQHINNAIHDLYVHM